MGESCKIMFLGGHFLFICSDTFAVGCYRLTTIHSVTDSMITILADRAV